MMMNSVVSGQWSVVGESAAGRPASRQRRRGITLTEILIAIMILGVGLVSLATLFPIGLLRLRDATRYTRSATLLQTAASDAVARGMFDSQTFQYADLLNYLYSLPPRGIIRRSRRGIKTPTGTFMRGVPSQLQPAAPGHGVLRRRSIRPEQPRRLRGVGRIGNEPTPRGQSGHAPVIQGVTQGPGLPFAYDPLWRYYTLSTAHGAQGYYIGDTYEARFGYGLTTIRPDSDGGPPSAHGLQRITNFNRPYVQNGNAQIPIMPSSIFIPNAFVSQEDVVWQDPNNNNYTINGVGHAGTSVPGPSPLLPDLSPPTGVVNGGSPSLDWRYSWMFTGQLNSASNLACFDGNIVIFENRQFGIQGGTGPFSPGGNFTSQNYQVDGETVVEAVFGFSTLVIPPLGPQAQAGAGYGSAAARTVLLRWSSSMPDPVVRPGDWIADVTYERQFQVVLSRFLSWPQANPNLQVGGLQNWANKLEWDNLPAQRCYWYQVQKVGTPSPDSQVPGHRSTLVFVNQNLVSRTVLNGSTGLPVYLNAALIAPNVINVIPQTIFIR